MYFFGCENCNTDFDSLAEYDEHLPTCEDRSVALVEAMPDYLEV